MRTMLMLMLGFTAFTAIPSGILLMIKPEDAFDMQVALLSNTPFHNFFYPGLILALLVGGTNLVAVYINLKKHDTSFFWSLAGGIMIAGWIMVQVILIREFFWMQWLYFFMGIFIFLITLQLKHKELF